jgi:hypothetical protein
VRNAPHGERLAVCTVEVGRIADVNVEEFLRDVATYDPNLDPPEDNEDGRAPATLPPPVPFPVDALPSSMRDYVWEASKSLGCPPDYIAVPMLACAGAAVGTSVKLQVKRDWYEWPSLYVAIVAPSGCKKTPALEYALQFTQDKGVEFGLAHQQAMQIYDHQMAEYRMMQEVRKRARDKSHLGDLPEKPQRPILKRTWIGDATVEAIAQKLQQNPRGLMLVQDEISSLLLRFNQYRGGRGADLQFFLSTWSCHPTAVDRKQDEDPVILNRPFLSIVGGIQPALLVKVFGGDRLYDGFTPRFFFSDPELMTHRSSDATISEESLQRVQACFEALYKICPVDPYAIIPVPQLVRLAPDARALFVEWENRLGSEIDRLNADDPFRATLSKLIAYLARIALIMHVSEYVSGEHDHFEEMTEGTMTAAVRIAEYFLAHARRVWHRLAESADDSRMRQILNWITRKRRPVTARDVLRGRVAALKTAKETVEILTQMVDCGLLDQTQESHRVRYSLRQGAHHGQT